MLGPISDSSGLRTEDQRPADVGGAAGLHQGDPWIGDLAGPGPSLYLENRLYHLRSSVETAHSEGAAAGVERKFAVAGSRVVLDGKVGLAFRVEAEAFEPEVGKVREAVV